MAGLRLGAGRYPLAVILSTLILILNFSGIRAPNNLSPWSSAAMVTICRTSDGDLLDTLCYQYYGHLGGTVEAVLAANRLLADEPQPLRAGLLITFSDIAERLVGQVQLWD